MAIQRVKKTFEERMKERRAKTLTIKDKRISDSVRFHLNMEKHYTGFMKKKSVNIKHKIAPKHIKLDSKGYRL